MGNVTDVIPIRTFELVKGVLLFLWSLTGTWIFVNLDLTHEY